MDMLSLTSCLILVLLSSTDVDSDVSVPPQNTAVVTNNSTILQCTSTISSASVGWNQNGNPIARGCIVSSNYTARLTTIENVPNKECNLQVKNASQADIGTYTCLDADLNSHSAYLIVLVNVPSGLSSGTGFVIENSSVSMSCSAQYGSTLNSGVTASLTWSGSSCPSSTTNGNASHASSTIIVNAQRPTVQSCSCTTRFSAPTSLPSLATNAPTYSSTWSSPSGVLVSYCPVSVTVNVVQNTTLMCSATAYPAVSRYDWKNYTGYGVPSGSNFTVTSPGDYNISCLATNYLSGGTNSPCVNESTVTGFIASTCPSDIKIERTSEQNEFVCSAKAIPPVSVYRWTLTINGINKTGNGSTYKITDGGNYTLTCTATNYLYDNMSDPCSTSTSIDDFAAVTDECTGLCEPGRTILIVVLCVVGVVAIVGLSVLFAYPKSPCYKCRRCWRQPNRETNYKEQNKNDQSAHAENRHNPPNNQTPEMEMLPSPTHQQDPGHSPPYNGNPTGYEAGQPQLIYAELTKPGEILPDIHNQPGSRKPVTPVEENPYAAVERA